MVLVNTLKSRENRRHNCRQYNTMASGFTKHAIVYKNQTSHAEIKLDYTLK